MNDRELLELIARALERQEKLLEQIRDQLVPDTYPQPTGGSITVRS
jgi:hypothetical protein